MAVFFSHPLPAPVPPLCFGAFSPFPLPAPPPLRGGAAPALFRAFVVGLVCRFVVLVLYTCVLSD